MCFICVLLLWQSILTCRDQYTFYLVAVETLDPFNETAYELVGDLGRRIAMEGR